MSKFDFVYSELQSLLKEEKNYITSTFVDNVRLLVKMLKDNDYLPANQTTEETVNHIVNQQDNVKELILDTQEGALPPIKLLLKQPNATSESFSVSVIDVSKPDQQEEFDTVNTMLETVFEDVLNHIKTIKLKSLGADNAIETMPKEETALAQPEAQQSALPPSP